MTVYENYDVIAFTSCIQIFTVNSTRGTWVLNYWSFDEAWCGVVLSSGNLCPINHLKLF